MFVTETQLRVRYGETDQMGYAYYGNYALYFEVARVESLRHVGLSYKLMEDEGVMMPVLEMHNRFLKPALYDDLLTIKTTVKQLPEATITFDFEVHNEAGILLTTGMVRLVFINKFSKRPCRCPEKFLHQLRGYFIHADNHS